MGIEDGVCLQPCAWVGEHEFLLKLTIFINILYSFYFDVSGHSIVLVFKIVAQVYPFLYPRKGVATKVYIYLEDQVLF